MIADDFTGAMDTGAQFARAGLHTQFAVQIAPHLALAPPGSAAVEVISTGSRALPPAEAAHRCREAARRLAGRTLFKKVDSTLRGPVSAEIEAILNASGLSKALLCPAAPAQGRTVLGGQLSVHGVLLHQSAFRSDPAFPARHSDLSALLNRPTTHLPIQVVRQSGDALPRAIAAAPPDLITADAETQNDLTRLCRAGLAQGCLLCGAFGLAAAWAGIIAGGRLAPADPAFLRLPVLVVSGSAHPATAAQIRRLAAHPETVRWPIQPGMTIEEQAVLVDRLCAGPLPPLTILHQSAAEVFPGPQWRGISRLVAQTAAQVVRRSRPAALLVIGGETAGHLFDALGAQAVTLLGEAAPGIPHGLLEGGQAAGLQLITKAGGFGEETSLEELLFKR